MGGTIITITIILAILGVAASVWSIVSTRKKYYKDYLKRKRNEGD